MSLNIFVISFKKNYETTFSFRGNDLDMNVEGAWRQGITGKGKLNEILFSCFNQDLFFFHIKSMIFSYYKVWQ